VGQVPEYVHDPVAVGGIQIASGLVGQQQSCPGGKRPGNGHPLLLPAREVGQKAPPLFLGNVVPLALAQERARELLAAESTR
jgi:hypothetical protein